MTIRTKRFILLASTIFLIVLIDRLLLIRLGLPLWEWDEKLHYKHRPNVTRYWKDYGNKPLVINEYGQHDYSYPIKKRTKELRILDLGDSITMGHGVTRNETFSHYLEKILEDSLKNFQFIKVINTGVQGYSTYQELEVLKSDLIFQPDIVTIGFCLNDVTEPFIVESNLGGTGLDYHKVTQAPNKYLSFFLNETGYGRLIQEIRIRKLDAKQEKLNELWDVKRMLLHRNDSTYLAQWNFTLDKLTEIYNICNSNNIKPVLLIFPYTFQFNSPSLSWAQDLLIKHANENGVIYIDYLKVFETLTSGDSSKVKQYYLDEDHFTPKGHEVVATELSKVAIKLKRSLAP